MPEERMIKKLHKWKPILRRSLGRPKNRREDDIKNDMKKLKIKNWTNCIRVVKNGNYMLRRPKNSKNEFVAPKEEEVSQVTPRMFSSVLFSIKYSPIG
jgi:hypothetical protein